MLRRKCLVYQHETSKRQWCENHDIYFLSVQYEGTNRLDATLVRSVHDICSSFILPMTFDEIATCMIESEDDEVVNLSDR
jgi:hypothetical protein